MDGGGRVAQPLKWSPRPRGANAAAGLSRFTSGFEIPVRLKRLARRHLAPGPERRLPRGLGIAATTLLVVASLAYGTVKGDHVAEFVVELKDARDALANTAGFRIAQSSISGRHQLGESDVLALAGVTERTSL